MGTLTGKRIRKCKQEARPYLLIHYHEINFLFSLDAFRFFFNPWNLFILLGFSGVNLLTLVLLAFSGSFKMDDSCLFNLKKYFLNYFLPSFVCSLTLEFLFCWCFGRPSEIDRFCLLIFPYIFHLHIFLF